MVNRLYPYAGEAMDWGGGTGQNELNNLNEVWRAELFIDLLHFVKNILYLRWLGPVIAVLQSVLLTRD